MEKGPAKLDLTVESARHKGSVSSGGYRINLEEEIKKFMDSEKSICPFYTDYRAGKIKIIFQKCRVCKGRNYNCPDYQTYILREINVDCETVKKVLEYRIIEK